MDNRIITGIKAEAVADMLTTERIGRRLILLDETDSTNAEAKRNSMLPDGTVIVAERQSSGRGRLGRSWDSEAGSGLYLSVLLKPDIQPEYVSQITLAAGLAVCRAVSNNARIKWPNDIVIGSKKVCGILTEMHAQNGSVNHVVCGIGINVNTKQFDAELSQKATSLLLETGVEYDRSVILANVLNNLEYYLDHLIKDSFKALKDEYIRLCATLNREITVIHSTGSYTAEAVDIADTGELIIKKDGVLLPLNSGEVSVRGLLGYI